MFRRNTIVLKYLLITGAIAILYEVGIISLFMVIVLAYFPIRLIWSLIEFVLDYFDSVFVLRGLSVFRKRQYDKKMQRYDRLRQGVKIQKNLLIPYQTTSHTALPRMMIFDVKEMKGL